MPENLVDQSRRERKRGQEWQVRTINSGKGIKTARRRERGAENAVQDEVRSPSGGKWKEKKEREQRERNRKKPPEGHRETPVPRDAITKGVTMTTKKKHTQPRGMWQRQLQLRAVVRVRLYKQKPLVCFRSGFNFLMK